MGMVKGLRIFGDSLSQKYRRLRCLLHVKVLVICFHLGWSGSILQFRQNIVKVGSKSWLLTFSSIITLSLPSYTDSALNRELNFCNGHLSLLYFWWQFEHIIFPNGPRVLTADAFYRWIKTASRTFAYNFWLYATVWLDPFYMYDFVIDFYFLPDFASNFNVL
jgi:hypothetical protein